ncbi:MAG: hypothetical protein KAR65_11395 [Anaerolineales bacterium]|nr:hypothetical protein [Anaerolineales bacterium]
MPKNKGYEYTKTEGQTDEKFTPLDFRLKLNSGKNDARERGEDCKRFFPIDAGNGCGDEPLECGFRRL